MPFPRHMLFSVDALIFVHNSNYTDANIYLWTGIYNYFMSEIDNPDNKVCGANMGPTWVLSAPDGPQVGPINLSRKFFMPK